MQEGQQPAPKAPSAQDFATNPPVQPPVPTVVVGRDTYIAPFNENQRGPAGEHPFAQQSRQASKQTLELPEGHPGFVPVSSDVWQPYAVCAGVCGRLVSHHAPGFDERLYSVRERLADVPDEDKAALFTEHEHAAVVAGTNYPGVGLVCGAGCLYLKDPDHALFDADKAAGVDLESSLSAELRAVRRVLALRELKG